MPWITESYHCPLNGDNVDAVLYEYWWDEYTKRGMAHAMIKWHNNGNMPDNEEELIEKMIRDPNSEFYCPRPNGK
jgi:hypothetical protein